MPIVRAALVYGVLGFGAGFVFGTLREVVLIPAFGRAAGHWLEFIPLIAVIVLIAVMVMRRYRADTAGHALMLGLAGTLVLLVLESSFALLILGVPLQTYLAGFDITRGALFPFGLAIMTLAPVLVLLATRQRQG